MTRRSIIGFDRKIDLEWLDAAAGQVAAGATNAEVREYLSKLLTDQAAGDQQSKAVRNTMTVVTRIWSIVPEQVLPLRTRALQALPDVDGRQRLAIHWAMVLATYPFVTDVAGALGRLLTLQGTITLSQLTRRLVDTWGERSTMIRAAQRVVRSFVQWGVLEDTKEKGIYQQAPQRVSVTDDLAALLMEALLLDTEEQLVSVDQLTGHPALFPFEIDYGMNKLRQSPQFEVHRQGLDMDMVGLAKEKTEQPKQMSLL